MASLSSQSDLEPSVVDFEEVTFDRPPSPEERAKFRAALAAAPPALIEALEEAERLDRLVE